jgi:hypothetical protein
MTLPVWLSCPHLCRCPMSHRAFHRWSRLAVRPRVQVVRPRLKQRWTVTPRAHAARPPLPHAEAHGQTAIVGGPTTRTRTAASSPASPSSATSHAAPTTLATPSTPPAPRAAPTFTTTAAPPVAPEPYPLHYSRRPWATQEPLSPHLHQQSPPVKAVPVAPSINPHLMITRVKRGFRLPTDRLTLSATSVSIVSSVPSSVCATLINLN